MSEIASLYAAIGADTNPLERALGKAGGMLSSFGSTLGGAVSTAVGIGIARLGATAINAVSGAFTGAIKEASSFEQTMNVLGAVTGATKNEMKLMSDMAIKLGGDVTLPGTSATQAAEAMTELAKGGLSVRDAMAASTGTIQLARAAQVSEAEAATITANALNAFGLSGNRAGMVADLLAASANASSGSINDMAFALRMSSAVAASAGVSINDTTTAIGLLANAGLQGSDAGTSLKTMLMRLQAPTGDAADAMKALGIHVYDAHGKMLPFKSIIGELENSTNKLTQEQKAQALTTIFGADAIRAANILIKEGVKGFDEMSLAVNKTGAAQQLAAAQNAGLAGAMDALKSTVETLGLTFAQPMLEPLTRALKQLADWLSSSEVSNGIAQFGAQVGATFEQAVTWVVSNWPQITSTVGQVFAAVRSVWETVLRPVVTSIIEGVGEVVRWVVANWPQIQRVVGSVFAGIASFWNTTLAPVIGGILTALGGVVNWVIANWPWVEYYVGKAIADIKVWWDNVGAPAFQEMKRVFGIVVDWVKANWPKVQEEFGKVVNWVKENWPKVEKAFSDAGKEIDRINKTYIVPALEGMGLAFEAVKKWIDENWPKVQKTFTDVCAEIKKAYETYIKPTLDQWEISFGKIRDFINENSTTIKNILDGLFKTLQGIVKTGVAIIKGDWDGAWKGMGETLDGVSMVMSNQVTLVFNGIKRVVGETVEGLKKKWEESWLFLTGIMGNIWSSITMAWESVKESIGKKVEEIKTNLRDTWNKIRDTITEKATDIWNAAKRTWDTLVQDVSELPGKFIKIGRDIVFGLRDGIANAAASVFNAGSDLVQGIITVVKHDLGIHSPSTVFAEMGRQLMAGLAGGITDASNMPQRALDAATSGLSVPALGAGAFSGAGGSGPGGAAGRTANYTLNVTTTSPAENLFADFALLRALGG
ncbi:Phage tail tape measure protein [uncultured Caudovirales phage]|uniref:Phage tail tape measure protein n=1 Tax=uncultured Caudovirales phage TaxID=2100421 RepID=A0A6J5MNE7_9CAUD|nr:Phage tail tape measure protein [uncultured Caudovirales phage]